MGPAQRVLCPPSVYAPALQPEQGFFVSQPDLHAARAPLHIHHHPPVLPAIPASLSPLYRALVVIAAATGLALTIVALVYSHKIFAVIGPIAKSWRALPGGWVLVWLITFATAFHPLRLLDLADPGWAHLWLSQRVADRGDGKRGRRYRVVPYQPRNLLGLCPPPCWHGQAICRSGAGVAA